MPLGFYVHVPFCAVRCPYCDFNTYTSPEGRATYADDAIREVRAAARALAGRRVATVYFGGGTPTLLPPGDLVRVLRAIDDALGLEPDAEVTVEANPDSVDAAAFATLRAGGFTRVSIGMQSGAGHVLAALGRTHSGPRAVAAAREARAAGFEHVSLDLMYGSAVESDADWRASLETALSAEPDHLSLYNLTVEPGTRLAADVRRGRAGAPDEDAQARRYALADALLGEHGLRWYEVASFATGPAAHGRHNLGYWHGGDWWGVGPGAHSHLDGVRWWNVKRPATWAARVAAGESPAAGREVLTAEQRGLERLMLELRTRTGLPAAGSPEGGGRRPPLPPLAPERVPSPPLPPLDPERVTSLVEDGLLSREGDRLVLTLRGRVLADLVTRELAASAGPTSGAPPLSGTFA